MTFYESRTKRAVEELRAASSIDTVIVAEVETALSGLQARLTL